MRRLDCYGSGQDDCLADAERPAFVDGASSCEYQRADEKGQASLEQPRVIMKSAQALKKEMDALGIEAELAYPGSKSRYRNIAHFFKEKLLGERVEETTSKGDE